MFSNWIFLLLLPLVIALGLYAGRKDKAGGFKFSSGELVEGVRPSLKVVLSQRLIYVRLAALCLLVLALARPQSPVADSRVKTEGIDIVLCVDSSTSMLAEDFKINGVRQDRISVVKSVVSEFIKGRPNDRMAIVTFAGRAYTVCPLTLDQGWLSANLERVRAGMVEDGTAIGSGIAASMNRLKNSKAKSRVVILLTDGRNNAGNISPLTAAEAAKALKARVYTIGAGSKGWIPYPVRDMFGNRGYQQVRADIDEELLTRIADATDAKYYRATDTESLRNIYREIDKLERTPMRDRGYQEYNELFPLFLVPGVILLFLEISLNNTILRRIP